jgi:predicted nuclease with TOPRIM domain
LFTYLNNQTVSTTEQHLKRIQDKVQQLLKQQVSLQKENLALKEELDTIKKETSQFREDSATLKQQVEILKYSNGEMDEADKKQFEKRINTYLKEIDRCIAMLSQ